jgi:hypothetical protein
VKFGVATAQMSAHNVTIRADFPIEEELLGLAPAQLGE